MASIIRRIASISVLLFLCACSPQDAHYFNDGGGTELGYSNIGNQTQLLQNYVNAICRQAGGPVGSCGGSWNSFVQAGMNDIDSRCDAYLEWLDTRTRSTGPILQQIGDTQGATTSILLATGTGTGPIGIVAAAFGLARNTFNNINSRLITEVDHSTVQTIVLEAQTRFRSDLQTINVSSEPEAIYALRQYLRICMPFTIENQINTTLTTFARGGARALEDSNRVPLIATSTIGTKPVSPREIVVRPIYSNIGIGSEYAAVLVQLNKAFSPPYIQGVLAKLCVPPSEISHVDKRTNGRIRAFQQWLLLQGNDAKVSVTGKLSDREVSIANGYANCPTDKFENIFEETSFPSGINDPGIIALLNKHLPDNQKLPGNATVAEIRARISIVRGALSERITLKDPSLSNQLTWDLMQALGKDS